MSLRQKTLLVVGLTLAALIATLQIILLVIPLDAAAMVDLGLAIRNIRWILVATGLAYGATIFVLSERVVASRLSGLAANVRQVSAKNDPSLRVAEAGNDEVAKLAGTINEMLGALQQTQQTLQEREGQLSGFREELERRVGERTSALAAANREMEREVAERRRTEQAQAIAYRIADAANRETSLEELLRYIRRELGAIIDTKNFYIALQDPAQQLLRFPYYVDENLPEPGYTTTRVRKLAKGLTEYVLRTGRPLLVTGEEIEALAARGEVEAVGAAASLWLGVPLSTNQHAIGVVAVQSYSGVATYTEDDLELLRFVSGQIAAAIERLRRDELLHQQSAAMEASVDGMAVIGIDNEQFVYLNEAQARMHGYDTPDELTGSPWHTLYGGEERARAEREIKPALEAHGQWRGELLGRRRDGSTFPQELSLTNVSGVGLVAVVRDISERRRLEEQFRQAQKMEAVGRLAGGVAHDFNNLLTAITGYACLVRDALPVNHPAWGDTGQILAASERAANLTRQLLAFSRRQVFSPEIVCLNDIILNLGKMLHRLICEDIELQILPAPDLGAVRVDPHQLEQVIINLVVNAGDAMPGGGRLTIETGSVTLDAEYARQHVGVTPGEYCMLAVSDTGCGMTDDVKARIFEPFFTTKEPGKGTGLGLATSYGIVKQSGGHIWVYSEPGKGTTFKVYLPWVEEEPVVLPGNEEEEAARSNGARTVLLVEDEPSVRSFAARVLHEMGYTVLEAANGSEALSLAADHANRPIHLLLTDLVMPQMGGEKLASELKPAQPEMKVLYVSGYTANAVADRGMLNEGVAFLQKPFTLAGLSQKVRQVLES